MRKRIFILLSVILALAACTHSSYNTQLVSVDSLLKSHPDSALLQLRTMSFSSEADRMYHTLLLADAANKCYDTLPSDSLLREVAEFYDRHGTSNEQVRAHYLLGCAYRDLGEAPQALDCFHDAIDRADTTATDCDYYTLSRVHAQAAALLGEQMLPYQQLDELLLQYSTAMKAKDTLCALNAVSQEITAYDFLEMSDSVISISNRLASIYHERGETELEAICFGGIATSLIDQGKYANSKYYLDQYELKSGLFDEKHTIAKGREVYYGTKGRYYIGINKYDSAAYYFYKELNAEDLNNREYAFRGLYLLYKETGPSDSLAKYSNLAYQSIDDHFKEKQTLDLLHMQSLYNYNRSQSLAHQKTLEANRSKLSIVILVFILSAVLMAGISLYAVFNRQKEKQLHKLRMDYEYAKGQLEQANYDLMKMQEDQEREMVHLIKEKAEDIEQLQQQIKVYEQQLSIKIVQKLESSLSETAIYKRFRYLVAHPLEKVSSDDWSELRKMMDSQIPHFSQILYGSYPRLKASDFDLCILVRLYFSPSEIAVLTDMALSTVSMRRYRLLEKLFGQKRGKAEDFDQIIRRIR